MDIATLQAQRLDRIGAVLEERQLDAYIATNTSDIRWLSAFSNTFDGYETAHLAVIATAQSRASGGQAQRFDLHTDGRYSTGMRALSKGTAAVIDDERIGLYAYAAKQIAALRAEGVLSGTLRIGIENDLPLNSYRTLLKRLDEAGLVGYELVESANLIKDIRAIKDAAEVETLKQAQAITDAGFDYLLQYLRPGISELEVAAELEYKMRSLGAGALAFSSIIASGPNSAVPHSVPGQRLLQAGDFVLLDFGARVDDYCSDMTRTVVLGKATSEQRRIYDAVLAAQSAAKELVRPGIEAAEVARRADEVLEAAGFGALIHGLGHGVGIDIHEEPVLNPKRKERLVAGHVVTVEPGIYVEGLGGVRIEDYGVVTTSGFQTFTQSSHELFEL